MNEIEAGAYAEAFGHLGGISAVLGGLAFTAAAALLSAAVGTRDPGALGLPAKLTVGAATASAVSLVVAAVTWSLSAMRASIAAGAGAEAPEVVFRLHPMASLAFLLGVVLLFAGVAASGWIGSRRLGYVTTLVGLAGGVLALVVVLAFGSFSR